MTVGNERVTPPYGSLPSDYYSDYMRHAEQATDPALAATYRLQAALSLSDGTV